MHYASTEQLGVLIRWCRDGSRSLDPEASGRGSGTVTNYRRRASLNALASLIHMWGLEPGYEKLRQEILGKDIEGISIRLRLELVRHARMRGLVTRGGESGVPLTGMQMEALVRLSWGQNMNELATSMAVSKTSLSGLFVRAKQATGTVTVYELVACAYRNAWLPDTFELQSGLTDATQLDLFDGDRARQYGESA